MKIYEILNKISQQRKHLEEAGLIKEAAEHKKIEQGLRDYMKTQVFTKKEVNREWETSGVDISEFINKIITLLTAMAQLPKEEVEQRYNVNNIKTMYWLAANSNFDMNRIIEGMKSSQIGELTKYNPETAEHRRKIGVLEQNMDLYTEIRNLFLYEKGEWVSAVADFYNNFDSRAILLSDLAQGEVTHIDNLYSIFEKTQIPLECIQRLSIAIGSQTPNRGRFETLFALLCKGGKFKVKVDKTQYQDTESGDIIIDKHGIELKVNAGSGGGRVGGQKGYTTVESIRKEYQTALKKFCSWIDNSFKSQIPADNLDLKNQYDTVMGAYASGSIQLSANVLKQFSSRTKNTKYIDDVIVELLSIIVAIIGQPDASMNIKIMEQIRIFYKSIWCNSCENDKVNNSIGGLIDDILNARSITDILNEGRIIPNQLFIPFSQMACARLFAYYANLEPFNYIFIINAKNASAPEMLVLSNNKVKSLANATYDEIKSMNLAFPELPTTYGDPARKVRPSVGLISEMA